MVFIRVIPFLIPCLSHHQVSFFKGPSISRPHTPTRQVHTAREAADRGREAAEGGWEMARVEEALGPLLGSARELGLHKALGGATSGKTPVGACEAQHSSFHFVKRFRGLLKGRTSYPTKQTSQDVCYMFLRLGHMGTCTTLSAGLHHENRSVRRE